jgi:hypothetical protein
LYESFDFLLFLLYSNTFYRKYDAQMGRFTGVDIMAEEFADLTPYQFGGNNPVLFNDPMGDMKRGPDGNYHVEWVNEMMWNNLGFFDWGNQGGGSGNYTNIQGISSSTIIANMRLGDHAAQSSKGTWGMRVASHVEIERNNNVVAYTSTWRSFASFTQNSFTVGMFGFGSGNKSSNNEEIGERYGGLINRGFTIMQMGQSPSSKARSRDPLLKFVGFRDEWIPEFESSLMDGKGAMTPGPFIIYPTRGSTNQYYSSHEPGHVLQFYLLGPFYYTTMVIIPSLLSAKFSSDHHNMPWEKTANQLWYWFSGESYEASNPLYLH